MELKEMTIEQLEERKTELVAEIDGCEEMEKLEELRSNIEAIKAEMETRAQIEAEKAEIRSAVANNEVPVVEVQTFPEERSEVKNMEEVRNSREYVEAYANYIKTGSDEEVRSLLTTNGTNGTVAIPDMVYDIVKTAWNKEGIIARVKKAYIKGNLKVGFEISATGAVVHTEGGDAVTEETLVLGTVTLVPKSIKKWISISDEAMDLRGEAFLQYIYDELAYQIAKKAADEVVAAIEACGTQSTATSVGVPVVSASAISIDLVAQALGNLSDEANNPVVMMNKATWSAFKAVQYANGYAVDPFEGLDVVFNNTIKSFAAASSGDTFAIVGDLGQGALINLPNGEGIEFKFDDKTDMTKALVRVLGREYIGIGIVGPNSFVKIKK